MEIQTIDVKNVCRCCVLPTSDLESIFDTFYENELLSKILLDVGKIEIKNDGLSNSICQACKIAAINAYKFQQMCIESERSLRILIGACNSENQEDPGEIKQEVYQVHTQEIITDSLIEDIKPIETDELEYEATEESYMDNESDNSDNSTEEIFECSNCSRTFKTNSKLENHMRKCQPKDVIDESDEGELDDKQEYPCTECSKVFKKASLLARHKKAHDPNKKPHECNKCNRRFPSNVALMRHDVLHSDLVERSKLNRDESQEFICVVCGRTFKTADNLATHLKVHKSKSDDNHEYKCKLCHDIFPSFSDILRHSKNHVENATHQVSYTFCQWILNNLLTFWGYFSVCYMQ
jgi:DNA-directed RNA polymerase subunit RPC12/RpoP